MTDVPGLSLNSPAPAGRVAGLLARARLLLRTGGDSDRLKRFAASAFAARVFNAGIGFGTQVLLARFMGEREYGLYAGIWIGLLTAGGIASLGLPVAALKLVPEYQAEPDAARLRGFVRAAPWLGALPAALLAALAAAALWGVGGGSGAYGPVALLALVALPLYVLTDIQTGIARAHDFADLGLAADYVVRPLLLVTLSGLLCIGTAPPTATAIMTASLAAVALTALWQAWALRARLAAAIPPGPARLEPGRWLAVGWPLLWVTALTLALGATDILLLPLFVGPEEVAIYFAAAKIVAVASFVGYGVANTSAHRFAAHLASQDRAAVARLAAETVRWTFWPTAAVAAALSLGAVPLLAIFGPGYGAGASAVAILALGLVLGAAVGPADRALAMAGQGRRVALIFAASLAANLLLCLALIPWLGLPGAALGTALATALRAALLEQAVRRELGLSMLVLAPAREAAQATGAAAPVAELLRLGEAESLAPAWSDLAGRALEPNPFYDPATALAGLRCLAGREARVVVAWRRDGAERRLIGILPVEAPRGRRLNPLPLRRTPDFYGTLSTPLLDPDRPAEALDAMLLALRRAGIRGLLLPFLHEGGPVATALDEACRIGGRTLRTLERHERALLRSPLAGRDFLRATLETRRRKEVERQRRRLEEQGRVAFEVVREPAAVAAALERFLDLEASGWKGLRGTDLKHAGGSADFIRATARGLAAAGRFRIASLLLDDAPIASGLVAVAGRRAFYLKTAYDERHARFSPGLLLTLDLTAHLLDDPEIDDADSIAVAGHPMIDRVWLERLPIAARLVSTGPGGAGFVAIAAAFEAARESVVLRLRPWRDRFRGSRPSPANHGARSEASEVSR